MGDGGGTIGAEVAGAKFGRRGVCDGASIVGAGCCDPGGVPKAQGTKAKAKVHHS